MIPFYTAVSAFMCALFVAASQLFIARGKHRDSLIAAIIAAVFLVFTIRFAWLHL